MMIAGWILVAIYTLCLLFILVYSIGQYFLTRMGKKIVVSAIKKPGPGLEEDYPFVTVQLPIYNEKYVVKRLIQACATLNYSRDKFEIQVLDDSTDETKEIISKEVFHWKKKGIDISHVKRSNRIGYKAGALKHALNFSKGNLIAIFDADFLPPRDFLMRAVPEFKESKVGMVQFPWGHINPNYSKLTRLQAFGLEAHFHVEQRGKSNEGLFLNFNGTAGMWRKECIIHAGNWQYDTLTEDLDLSYRAQLKGWKFKYIDDYEAPAELPIEMNAFRSQQFRWTKGAAETSKKLLPQILKAQIPLKTKFFSALHLLNSWVFISSFLLALLSVPILAVKHFDQAFSVYFDLATLFIISILFLGIYFFNAFKRSMYFNGNPLKFVLEFPVFLSAMMGLSLHNSLAALEGWYGKKTPFTRTPKFNSTNGGKSDQNSYVNPKIPVIAFVEFALMLYFVGGILLGVYLGDMALSPYHLLLVIGFAMISFWSFRDAKLFGTKG
jgi:cellulose synthase/poly-beta-1,6-N-acetylglucosamine synthase-like glycosyltransferase